MRPAGSLALAIPAVLALLACGDGDAGAGPGAARRAAAPGARPNVVLISVDTLRADHLGCYGYERDTSPQIDRFAAESIRFARAYAPAPWTLPSHATLLSGIHAYRLGIRGQRAAIPEDTPLVAELLSRRGYQTAAFVDSMPRGFVGSERGFARGFERFQHAPHREGLPFDYEIGATLEAGLAWLRGRDRSRPFFLFLHTKAVHAVPAARSGDPRHPPYWAPEPDGSRYLSPSQAELRWGDADGPNAVRYLLEQNLAFASGELDPRAYPAERAEALAGLYDGAIRHMDAHVGRFLDALGDLGLRDDTAIVLTADHGESFAEHNFLIHVEVYDDLLHVPLIVRLPGAAGGRVVETPVGLEDLAPTLLALAGAPIPPAIEGAALPLDGAGARSERRFFGYYLFGRADPLYDGFSLREGDWKLVRQRIGARDWETELYDLAADPEEEHPIEDQDGRSARLQALLAEWLAAPGSEPAAGIELDRETSDQLRALGYLE